jgi:hypothetical protein
MITERETAALVSEALQRFRTELQELHGRVERTSSPDDFAAYNKALSRILHHLDADILRPIYSRHPDLSPKP